MPYHRVVSMGGKRWLVVTAQGASGTCVSLAYDRWYEVGVGGVREVLSLPAKGHECTTTGYPTRKFSSRVLSLVDGERGEEFRVRFNIRQTVMMNSDDPDLDLGTRRQDAVYVRRAASAAFELDEGASEITGEEVRTAYNVGTFSGEDFLRFNYKSLRKVAEWGGRAHKEWLLGFLQDCEDSEGKSALLSVLEK